MEFQIPLKRTVMSRMRLQAARLEPDHLLVFVAGQAPIYGRQILYFRDPVFQQRAQIEAPVESDRIDAGNF